MNYQQIKLLFNNEWVSKLCDDLTSNTEFIQRNKINVLESLQASISNNLDYSTPMFKQQRQAYLFVSECIEKELEERCYIAG